MASFVAEGEVARAFTNKVIAAGVANVSGTFGADIDANQGGDEEMTGATAYAGTNQCSFYPENPKDLLKELQKADTRLVSAKKELAGLVREGEKLSRALEGKNKTYENVMWWSNPNPVRLDKVQADILELELKIKYNNRIVETKTVSLKRLEEDRKEKLNAYMLTRPIRTSKYDGWFAALQDWRYIFTVCD